MRIYLRINDMQRQQIDLLDRALASRLTRYGLDQEGEFMSLQDAISVSSLVTELYIASTNAESCLKPFADVSSNQSYGQRYSIRFPLTTRLGGKCGDDSPRVGHQWQLGPQEARPQTLKRSCSSSSLLIVHYLCVVL